MSYVIPCRNEIVPGQACTIEELCPACAEISKLRSQLQRGIQASHENDTSLDQWRKNVLIHAIEAGLPDGVGLVQWFTAVAHTARAESELARDGWLAGWIGAMISSVQAGSGSVPITPGIRRLLLRKGWFAPAEKEHGKHAGMITPAGQAHASMVGATFEHSE